MQVYSYQEFLEKRIHVQFHDKAELEWENHEWILVRVGEFRESHILHEQVAMMSPSDAFRGIAEWYYPDKTDMPKQMPYLFQMWQEIFNTPYIPYDRDERQTLCASAYSKLAPYIAIWNQRKENEMAFAEQARTAMPDTGQE